MTSNQLPWARLCVATFITIMAAPSQGATTHKIKPGENLSTLARKYHVPVQDIARANHITETTVLNLGRKIAIPDPPKHLVVSSTLHQSAFVKGDSVSARLGPGADFRRARMFYKGDPVVVTARRDEWSQIELPDGKFGWIRHDLLAIGKRPGVDSEAGKLASSAPAHPTETPKHRVHHTHALAEDRPRKHRHLAESHARAKNRIARRGRDHRHETQMALSHSRRRSRYLHEARRHDARRYARWSRRTRYVPEASMPAPTTDVVRTAYAYRGTPYVWGGAGRGGFDCSGFTSYLYHRRGVNLPHSASAQFRTGRHVAKHDLKPGDLVFFETVHRGISHVGMYVGNGRFVHASSRRSGGVRVDSLASGYYNERFRGARREK